MVSIVLRIVALMILTNTIQDKVVYYANFSNIRDVTSGKSTMSFCLEMGNIKTTLERPPYKPEMQNGSLTVSSKVEANHKMLHPLPPVVLL